MLEVERGHENLVRIVYRRWFM